METDLLKLLKRTRMSLVHDGGARGAVCTDRSDVRGRRRWRAGSLAEEESTGRDEAVCNGEGSSCFESGFGGGLVEAGGASGVCICMRTCVSRKGAWEVHLKVRSLPFQCPLRYRRCITVRIGVDSLHQ
jgi:hypothetical protein